MAEAVIKARKTRKRKFNGFDVFIFVFCFLFALICFYPMWYVFIASITPYEVFIKTPALFFPTDFDWSYYQSIFSSAIFQRSISISVFKTVTATALSVFTTSTMAYAVSKKHLKGMKLINFLVVFTMYFNGRPDPHLLPL